MYNIVVIGSGKTYSDHLNLIKYQELKGEINVIGIATDNKLNYNLDGYKVLPIKNVSSLDFDYCLVAVNDFKSFLKEARLYGLEIEKLIPIRALSIPHFSFSKYISLKLSKISIISFNCFGGMIYNYLGLEFLSPTINLYFLNADFLKFAKNFTYYIKQPLEFVKTQYDENLKQNFPVCKIDDIYIFFNHYSNFDEAQESWEKRKKKINFDNLFFVMYSDDKNIIEEFDNLTYENKLIFVTTKSNALSSFYLNKNFSKDKTFEHWQLINMTARNSYPAFDIIAMLNHESNFYR